MAPPPPKSLSERVKLATHIFVGTAKEMQVIDKDGKLVNQEQEPKVLGQRGHGAWLIVEVNEVLCPQGWNPTSNLVVQVPGGFFSTGDYRTNHVGVKLVYLTVTDGKTYKASYGWDLSESLGKKAEIESLIREVTKEAKEVNRK